MAALEFERLQRRFASNGFSDDPVMVVGMNDCPPVEVDGFLVRNAEEIDIGAVTEVALSVGASDPQGCRPAVGDRAEPHPASEKRLLPAFALVATTSQRVLP